MSDEPKIVEDSEDDDLTVRVSEADLRRLLEERRALREQVAELLRRSTKHLEDERALRAWVRKAIGKFSTVFLSAEEAKSLLDEARELLGELP